MRNLIWMISLVVFALVSVGRAEQRDYQFAFGTGTPQPGVQQVSAQDRYTAEKGFGIEPNVNVPTPGVTPLPPVGSERARCGRQHRERQAVHFFRRRAGRGLPRERDARRSCGRLHGNHQGRGPPADDRELARAPKARPPRGRFWCMSAGRKSPEPMSR